MKKQIIFTFITALTTSTCIGQNCSCISGTTDKNTGIESRGGITNSMDFYSLLLQRETNYKDSIVVPKFKLLLNAASSSSSSRHHS